MTLAEIEDTLPWGLHDAYWVRCEIDWTKRKLILELRVRIGEHQETERLAQVTVQGLAYFVALPPDPADRGAEEALPWIDSGSDAYSEKVRTMLPPTPPGGFAHYLYVRGPYQVFQLCGRSAELVWLESKPVPSKSRTRVAYPGEEIG